MNQKSLDKNKIWIEKTGIISPNTGIETIIIHNAFKLDKPLNKKKTKELDWHIKWDYLLNKKKWKNPDEVNKVLTKFVEDLLTQQRTELLEEIKDLQTYVLFNDTEKLISLEKVKSLLNKKDE